MSKWRKKPVVIDAEQVDGAAIKRGDAPPAGMHLWPDESGSQPRDMSWGYVDTANGRVHVHHGDWICRQTLGNRVDTWPCAPDIFAATYEPAAPLVTESAGGTNG